jgi:hypothetical protein
MLTAENNRLPMAPKPVDCGPGDDYVDYDEGVDIIDDTCETKTPQP